MLMILPKTINERFYEALCKKKKDYGRGFNKFICGETGYSSGYISQVLNGKQVASQEAQIKISEVCGFNYKSFLEDDGPCIEEILMAEKQEAEYYKKYPDKLALLKHEMEHSYPYENDIEDLLDAKIEAKLNAKLQTMQQTHQTPEPANDIEKRKRQRHHEIIDAFQNQQLAIEINQLLIKYEKLEADEGLSEIKSYLDYRITKAEGKKERTQPKIQTGTNGIEEK